MSADTIDIDEEKECPVPVVEVWLSGCYRHGLCFKTGYCASRSGNKKLHVGVNVPFSSLVQIYIHHGVFSG